MDVIVKSISRIMFPLMLVFGLYIALHGHLTPGGGFPAGAVIGTAFALLVISYNKKDVEYRLTHNKLIAVKSASAIILFLVIIRMSYMLREWFLGTQTLMGLWSGGFTPLTNLAGSFMVMTAIMMIIYSVVRK